MSAPNPYKISRLKLYEKLETEGSTSVHIACYTVITMEGEKRINAERLVKFIFSGDVSLRGSPLFPHKTEWTYTGNGSDLWDNKLQALMAAIDPAQRSKGAFDPGTELSASIDDKLTFGLLRNQAGDTFEYLEIKDVEMGISRNAKFEFLDNIRHIHGLLRQTAQY